MHQKVMFLEPCIKTLQVILGLHKASAAKNGESPLPLHPLDTTEHRISHLHTASVRLRILNPPPGQQSGGLWWEESSILSLGKLVAVSTLTASPSLHPSWSAP